MSTMVERVARAIGRAADENTPWEQCGDGFKEICREYACAAISAMKEPTQEMVTAGSIAGPFTIDRYRTMIRAALKENA